ncbi:Crp/Fnr family transcriptional regulator [Sphingomonas sp. SRS2]|uniref:Crp/Fnr family transcriptional regulator n=1 Tax=Sphingomonas sp. SRS2 TaxID=133190 RepID=UPI000618415F|nr:Crp/Fnr family transcriptional regulator [Sphingomonas sp. SRS2]KKC26577.1 Crp/Fnr family transcriptional regulator [Sphingomonas sp. SRS2]
MIDAVRHLPGFDALDAETIEVIVARSTVREFAAGHVVLPAGDVAETLLVRIGGELIGADGDVATPLFDAPGLLFGLAAQQDYRAGPAGFTALIIAKPHVFTIAREFPEFIVSLIDAREAGR